jgi:hypothetical protein
VATPAIVDSTRSQDNRTMDNLVVRERLKRRLQAARIRSRYKYKDPSKIQLEPSAIDTGTHRPSPFAAQILR